MRELKSTGVFRRRGNRVGAFRSVRLLPNFKSFGNGRFAREVLQKSVIAHANRVADSASSAQDDDVVIERCDIPGRRAMLDALNAEDASAEALLEGLIGLEHPKEKVLELERVVTYCGRRGARA